MPRRKDNEIYSYKLKSGKKRFGFKTYLGIEKESGKAIKVTRQGFKSRKEAESAKIQLKAEGAKTVTRKHRQRQKTVDDVWKLWLPVYSSTVRGSTIFRTKIYYEKHIQPEFGNSYINNIDPKHLQNFADRLSKKYVTFRPALNLLKRLIKYAIIQGWCDSNPFDRIIMPKHSGKKTKKRKNFYEPDELKKFLRIIKTKHNYNIYCYFMILASLGLRRGEGLALKWSDIDWNKKTIHIQRTVKLDSSGHKSIGKTKTKSGNRILPISNNLLKVLQHYRKLEKYDTPDSYLFHTATGDYPAAAMSGVWLKRIYYKQNIRHITPHGLRHTMATLLYQGNSKITPKDVQYMLGHSNVETALNIYTHITKKQKRNIRNSINNLNI